MHQSPPEIRADSSAVRATATREVVGVREALRNAGALAAK